MADNKELNEQVEEKQAKKKKKGAWGVVVLLAYLLMIVAIFMLVPILCPMILGYQTKNVNDDSTGQISPYGSVVYVKTIDCDNFIDGNIIAVESDDNFVDVHFVDKNNKGEEKITLRNGKTVDYDDVVGKVAAKTPFIGYLTQFCRDITGYAIAGGMLLAGVILMAVKNGADKKRNKKEEEAKASNK